MVPYWLKLASFREGNFNQERDERFPCRATLSVMFGCCAVCGNGRVGRWRLSKFALVSGLGISGIEGLYFHTFTSEDVVRHPLVQKIVEAYDAADAQAAYQGKLA